MTPKLPIAAITSLAQQPIRHHWATLVKSAIRGGIFSFPIISNKGDYNYPYDTCNDYSREKKNHLIVRKSISITLFAELEQEFKTKICIQKPLTYRTLYSIINDLHFFDLILFRITCTMHSVRTHTCIYTFCCFSQCLFRILIYFEIKKCVFAYCT